MTAVLQTDGLSVSYGGVDALVDVSLEVPESNLVGLIGPNGAGKTTLIDAVTGFATARGRVLLDGHDIMNMPPELRARRGLARTWQAAELFEELTVRENLTVSSSRPSIVETAREVFLGRATRPRAVDEALAFLELESLANLLPDELTLDQRKLVGVVRALAAQPRLILLDEPAAGLDTAQSLSLGRHLRQVVDERRVAMLLVDHDMGLVLSVCDYVVVLDFGRVIARGTPAEIRNDPTVIAAYLGSAAQEAEGDLEAAER